MRTLLYIIVITTSISLFAAEVPTQNIIKIPKHSKIAAQAKKILSHAQYAENKTRTEALIEGLRAIADNPTQAKASLACKKIALTDQPAAEDDNLLEEDNKELSYSKFDQFLVAWQSYCKAYGDIKIKEQLEPKDQEFISQQPSPIREQLFTQRHLEAENLVNKAMELFAKKQKKVALCQKRQKWGAVGGCCITISTLILYYMWGQDCNKKCS